MNRKLYVLARMKLLKRIGLWSLILALVFVIQGLLLVWYFESEIKQAAVKELNKSLNTPIQVGEIKLNFWEHFPHIALQFPNVKLSSSDSSSEDLLLEASEISMLFNIWDIYQKKYIVKKLFIKDALWYSKYNKQGQHNFEIFKKSNEKTNSSFKLQFNEIIIQNSIVKHFDEQSNQFLVFDIDDISAGADFSKDVFQLKLKSDFHIKSMLLNKISYLKDKHLKINSEFSVNLIENTYTFQNTSVNLERMNLLLNGFINLKKEEIDLNVDGKDLNIQSFLSILPKEFYQKSKDYSSDGSFYLNAIIKGSLNKNKSPLIAINAGIQNSSIVINNPEFKNIKLMNVNAKINYTNNSSASIHDDVLTISNISGLYNNEAFASTIRIENLINPYLNLSLRTKQDLVELTKLFPIKNLNITAGNIDLDIAIEGKLSDMKSAKNSKNLNASGQIKIIHLNALAKNYELAFQNLNANLSFQKYDLKINQLSFLLGESDLQLNGYFRNVFAYLLDNNQELVIDATVKSNKINLRQLLSSSKVNEGEVYKFKLSPKLRANLLLNAKQLSFDLFNAYNIEGKISIDNQLLIADYLSFQSQGGLVFSSIHFDTRNPIAMPMKIKLNMQKVNISNVFKEFNNFGLNIITDKNINGQLSTELLVGIVWDENLKSNPNLFTADGPLVIENGELNNFAPMLALSKYIDVNDLKNLRFSRLENNISIKNSTIYIPDMEIKSNALNLNLSGSHQFNNQIDYHLKILLSELSKKKSSKLQQSEFGEIEDDGSGKTTLFIRMYGDAANPKFSLDKQMIKKKIAEDLKQERQEVKQILKEEFGNWFKKDKEFREQLNEGAAEWERDIPNQNKNPNTKTDTLNTKNKKSKLEKLKQKLNEPIEEDL